MALVKVYNTKKQEVGEVDLPESVFNIEVSSAIIHQAVVTQLAGRRRGTASTKTKAEVRGGGRKPFRQKGTGNARQGSTRSPLMPGGGESFGPKPRSYFKTFPKKMAAAAMRSALSDKFGSERLVVIDDFKLGAAKTKEVAAVLTTFGLNKALIVDGNNKDLELASRNLERHKYLRIEGVNVYDVVNHDWLVLSKSAALALGERLDGEKKGANVPKAKKTKGETKAKAVKA
ncbi:MAG: 50S ribosomal protein L4 [Proteobacteria bacterium]|jgi:large subunit ribosomal protein L4|nr:MAG: 50S ribosomal protein L4 [Pseudomonadota bacterium]